MSIQPLPGDVVAQIKSSAAITSLSCAVCGLLRNTLDAGASRVSISVDYSRGNCSVEDNGVGIPPASFQEDGGLGKLHYSSKFPPRNDCHGRYGEFLANLAALSLVSITSHHCDYRSHNSLTIHNSRVVARNLPALPEQRMLASTSGTRVVVRDLFGSMPVRVKQRAAEVERAGTARDFDQLIIRIVALLLPWPGEVAVNVQDIYAHRTVSLIASGAVDWSRDYRSTAPDILRRTQTLLTQASLLDNEDCKSWVSIGAAASGISVRGCVSLRPAATKRVQFIAIGIRPLSNEQHSNIFYEGVNRVFQDSSFGVVEEATTAEDDLPNKTEGFTGRELKPRKGIDRWPMFFLQIMFATGAPSLDVEELLDQRQQTVVVITDLLQVMAHEFLKKHHFRPRSVAAIEKLKRSRIDVPAPTSQPPSIPTPALSKDGSKSGQRGTPSTSKPRRREASVLSRRNLNSTAPRTPSPFASWARVKSSMPKDSGGKSSSPSLQPSQSIERKRDVEPSLSRARSVGSLKAQRPLFDNSGALLRRPFEDVDEVVATPPREPGELSSISDTYANAVKETVVWMDPTTKIRSLIDARTGFAVKPRRDEQETAPKPTTVKRDGNTARSRKGTLTSPDEQTTVFHPLEPLIPKALEPSETFDGGHRCEHMGYQAGEAIGGGVSTTLEGRISKPALRNAEVLSQVDQKFILAKVAAEPSSSSPQPLAEADCMLLLIDQHAADERCRVEQLLESYFVPNLDGSGGLVGETQSLEKPLRFDLSRQDGELLVRFGGHFEHWGIVYEVFDGRECAAQKGVTVEVRMLPPAILERCRVEPRVLVDLLRKEIWKLQGTAGLSRGPNRVASGRDWVARFHECPEGILDLINSRACRSAIMFNDPLTAEQCSALVRRLALCAFPFQCAHGRPSMVPLVHLGQDGGLGSAMGGKEIGAAKSEDLLGDLKRWRQTKDNTQV